MVKFRFFCVYQTVRRESWVVIYTKFWLNGYKTMYNWYFYFIDSSIRSPACEKCVNMIRLVDDLMQLFE
mgnify:CR=1 FL=1